MLTRGGLRLGGWGREWNDLSKQSKRGNREFNYCVHGKREGCRDDAMEERRLVAIANGVIGGWVVVDGWVVGCSRVGVVEYQVWDA